MTDPTSSPKILVLGCETNLASQAYAWKDSPSNLSVGDFDVVLMHFSGFRISVKSKFLPSSLPAAPQFIRQLFSSNSEIVVIGSPAAALIGTLDSYASATWWLPLTLDVHQETGTGIQVTDPEFEFFFRHVPEWNFYVTEHWRENDSTISVPKAFHPTAGGLKANFTPIAKTRFGESVGFKIELTLSVGSEGQRKRVTSGPIYWLPEPVGLSPKETIDLVLRERYRVGTQTLVPAWAGGYALPRQVEAAARVQEKEAAVRHAETELATAEAEYREEAQLQALLFERGESLEDLVRRAFAVLGAEVEERPRDREDGRLSIAGRNAIIEVKGRTGPARLQDVRQLHHWVSDAIAEEDWTGKGILIVNAFLEEDPADRGDPFPENTSRAAVRFGLVLITTTQLFELIAKHQRGELDLEAFWKTVFDTVGMAKFQEIESSEDGDHPVGKRHKVAVLPQHLSSGH